MRKGGISEKALMELISEEKFKHFDIEIVSKKHNEFKKETENLEGPGQFLRHYAPNIESYLFDG